MELMDTLETEKKISLQACNVLNDLRQSGQLCDAVIKVEDGQFPVHRPIISACSPYFRALFTNGMTETAQREIFIPGTTAEVMSQIIEYAYTRNATITAANVERLLPAADQFHVLGLLKSCTAFLMKELDLDNCIGIRNFARNYFCETLGKSSFFFITQCSRFILSHRLDTERCDCIVISFHIIFYVCFSRFSPSF